MDIWPVILIIIGIAFLTWLVDLLFFAPARREHEAIVDETLGRQARKRNGTVSGKVLTIPHKTVTLEVSFREDSDGPESHTYATFRTEAFQDKKFGILYRKELLLRPLFLVGSRLEVFEEQLGGTYVVSGNDVSFVERVLTPEIRRKLLEFEDARLRVQFGRPHGASLLSRGRGWLTVSSYLNGGVLEQDYDRVIETALLFHGSLERLSRR